jgi:hypothetical protein
MSVTLALMLAFASLAGSAAHARNCHHSDVHAHDVAHHAEQVDECAGHADCDRSGTSVPAAPTQHSDCTDMFCHGGVALLYAASALKPEFWPRAAVLPWNHFAAPPVGPGRLDRPPKSFVSA